MATAFSLFSLMGLRYIDRAMIKLTKSAGFCSGVKRAMSLSEQALEQYGPPIVTCGPLVHNQEVIRYLTDRGIAMIDDPTQITGRTVVIRTHGLAPELQSQLVARNVRVIDATCPKILRIQEIITRQVQNGFQILIAGDHDHPEVQGLLGYAQGKGQVIGSPKQAATIAEGPEPLCLVSQTTQETDWFEEVAAAVQRQVKQRSLKVHNTICNTSRQRQQEAGDLADQVRQMIVVGSRNSSNTLRLLQVIRKSGKPAVLVENEKEIDPDWLKKDASVGLAAGASTPDWVIERVVRRLEELLSDNRPPGLELNPSG